MPTPPPTPAQRLLVELCRRHPSPERVADLATDPGIFAELATESMRQAVQGLVFSRLAELGGSGEVFEGGAEAIGATLTLLRKQAIFWDMEQDRVMAGLDRAGVSPLVLKGGALRRGIFRPVERIMGDLDILVETADVERVLEALAVLGYRSEYPDRAREGFLEHHHHDRVAHARGFLVEVHWGLTRPGDVIQLDPHAFQSRAVTTSTPGSPPLRVPSLEDTLIHTVSQSEQDGVTELRRIVDLDRIVRHRDLDWDYVRRSADEAGLHGFLCVTLCIAHRLLGTTIPDDLLAGEGLRPADRRHIAGLRPEWRVVHGTGAGSVAESYVFRFLCARPDHRRRWLQDRIRGIGDPLRWVWEGGEAPEDVPGEKTTGPAFVLKLLVVRSILQVSHWIAGSRGGPPEFWSPRAAT
jgi:hypothetical protein